MSILPILNLYPESEQTASWENGNWLRSISVFHIVPNPGNGALFSNILAHTTSEIDGVDVGRVTDGYTNKASSSIPISHSHNEDKEETMNVIYE